MRGFLYDVLRKATSSRLRQWFKRQPWFVPACRAIFGNHVYSRGYYTDVERIERASVPHIARWIQEVLAPKRVLDVGCGPGHMMEALSKTGISVYGVDVSVAAIEATRSKGLSAESFDLTRPDGALPGTPYDLAISCEVAEHLDQQFARRFVEHLTSAANLVYLTAAEPGQNIGVGLFHVNEQPHSYWVSLFEERGFEFLADLSQKARSIFSSHQVVSYLAKPLVFRKRQ